MAFKMKGWAPKGPLKYKGGGKATNMPTTNSAFPNENNTNERSARDYANSSQTRAWLNDMYGDKNLTKNEGSGGSYGNLNDEIDPNAKNMDWVNENHTTVKLSHDDIHNLKIAVQRGGLDEVTKKAYGDLINRGAGSTTVFGEKEMNYQTNTGGVVTNPKSAHAISSVLDALNKGRGNQQKREDAKNTPTSLSTIKPSKIKTKYDSKNYQMNYRFEPKISNNTSTNTNINNNRNIEGNKGPTTNKTLSQKRAAAVNQKKLSSYGKAWESNKGGVQGKYKNKAEFVKAAEAWWETKGL